jgi:hypothetical protein
MSVLGLMLAISVLLTVPAGARGPLSSYSGAVLSISQLLQTVFRYLAGVSPAQPRPSFGTIERACVRAQTQPRSSAATGSSASKRPTVSGIGTVKCNLA